MVEIRIQALPSESRAMPMIMPFYTAEGKNILVRGKRPYSVVEILRGPFGRDFYVSISEYMKSYPASVRADIGQPDATNIELVWLSEPRVESTKNQFINSVSVDLIFNAVLRADVPADTGKNKGAGTKKRTFHTTYRTRCVLDLGEAKCTPPLVCPARFFPRDIIVDQKINPVNEYLLPIMYAKDYPEKAHNILEVYYPEALAKATAVDGKELARRMGLTVQVVRFEKGSDIQGRIYFDRTTEKVRNSRGEEEELTVEPRTILINRDLCPTRDIENSTIIHECVHYSLDYWFFRLQMISGTSYQSYTSRKKTKKPYGQYNSAIDWMELQAEKLPAYILMEETNTKKEIERLLAVNGGCRTPENMYRIMEELSRIFKVTRSMAKYRMIELGYPEAEGIFAYKDGIRIPDHGCSGGWKPGVTYTISRKEAAQLIAESQAFADALRSGCYTYIEGHYCLRDGRYIAQYRNGARYMTPYARHHMDECCISFTVQGRNANTTYADSQAARKKPVTNMLQSRHALDAEPASKEWDKQADMIVKDSARWMDLMHRLPNSVDAAIQMLLDEKGVSQNELAMRMGVSRAALRKWCTQRMTLRHLVAICIALDLRADIGEELVRLAGIRKSNTVEYNLLYHMLFETKDLTVEAANLIMDKEKLPRLTQGQDEAMAG